MVANFNSLNLTNYLQKLATDTCVEMKPLPKRVIAEINVNVFEAYTYIYLLFVAL